jgi:TIR domain
MLATIGQADYHSQRVYALQLRSGHDGQSGRLRVRNSLSKETSALPIFISYSHSDAAFAEKLATHLVAANAHVWIDSWELNVGDSLIERIQNAIQESSALLVVLSKASVASEWCKKELNAGLMRELDEKRVLVLPVLVEECERPPFLREKKYADFRTNFDIGLRSLIPALAQFTNTEQGRLTSGPVNTDWAETWGEDGDKQFFMEFTLIETSIDRPFSLLTKIHIGCNSAATRRYKQYETEGLDWLGRFVITETVAEFAGAQDLRVILEDSFPQITGLKLVDKSTENEYDVEIRCQRLGEDNGKDQLVYVANYLGEIRDHVRRNLRRLTSDEAGRLAKILSRR